MATAYTTTAAMGPGYGAGGGPTPTADNMRSVTPATNNTRLMHRHASAPRSGGPMMMGGVAQHPPGEPYASNRSLTPSRYMSGYDRTDDGMGGAAADARAPSSTGLIRLSLKKPMGIVFEPMYDPNQKSLQRGVRICDLPRTGAAALSRKLQVGDELLQINDKTVSRLNFDQIMDFIIEADPESVNLLFRRPRKETLQARQGVHQKLKAAANKDAPSTVKWVDEGHHEEGGGGGGGGGGHHHRKKGDRKDRKEKKDSKKKRSKKGSVSEDEEETIQSSTAGDDSYVKNTDRRRKKSKSRRDPYESESFLDLLIDTICSNSNNVCRDGFRRGDDDYFSEDEESFVTDAEDESTYMTYDESIEQRAKRHKKKQQQQKLKERQRQQQQLDEETEDGTRTDGTDGDEEDHHKHKSQRKDIIEKVDSKEHKKKYEDDGTLETSESAQRGGQAEPPIAPPQPPLGLAPQNPVVVEPTQQSPGVPAAVPPSEPEDDGNPAPIKELEYDDRIDHGADVSVMESLGGPSLLIEKQRAAAAQANHMPRAVPTEVMDKYGLDYPANFAMTREQTIQADPLKYYTYVVKVLLEEHEPEKVRLLDKLLAKYKGREDHLVQKLAVRYDRSQENGNHPTIPEEHDEEAFTDAVKKNKSSSSAAAAVHTAKELMHIAEPELEHQFDEPEWPEKESKEPDIGDEVDDEEEEESESGSDYSRDSVDGTSPAVIAQVSELLNYVYGKTSVPGQIDRVSTIMRAYEGREAVLLELLETKALIKANKEKENADNLPSFLRNSQQMVQAHLKAGDVEASELPPVTPMATQPVTDDISSMSGVSSPAQERETSGVVANSQYHAEEVEVTHTQAMDDHQSSIMDTPSNLNTSLSTTRSSTKPPVTPDKDKTKKKKGLFGGLFGKKKRDGTTTPARAGSRSRNNRKKG